MILFTRYLTTLGGETALAAFATMINICNILWGVVFGFGHALQPIASYFYGAGRYDKVIQCYTIAQRSAIGTSIILSSLALLFSTQIVHLFSTTDSVFISMTLTATRAMYFVLPFAAYCIIVYGFFQAIGEYKIATFFIFLRTFLSVIFFMLILTHFFGLLGIWLTYPFAEFFSSVLYFGVMHFHPNINSFFSIVNYKIK